MTDTPIWSQITTSPDIQNRGVLSCVKATVDTTARHTLRTWVMSGVFHNTNHETAQMRAPMGHYLTENDLRLPNECKTALVLKWSHSVAQAAEQGREAPDPSVCKPSRFPNKTARAVPGPYH